MKLIEKITLFLAEALLVIVSLIHHETLFLLLLILSQGFIGMSLFAFQSSEEEVQRPKRKVFSIGLTFLLSGSIFAAFSNLKDVKHNLSTWTEVTDFLVGGGDYLVIFLGLCCLAVSVTGSLVFKKRIEE